MATDDSSSIAAALVAQGFWTEGDLKTDPCLFSTLWRQQAHPEWQTAVPEDFVDLLDGVQRDVVALDSDDAAFVCPPPGQMFSAFAQWPPSVVVVGQDPYFAMYGDPAAAVDKAAAEACFAADGTAFSCGVKTQPSLRNILKEVEESTGLKHPDTSLADWAAQGVFMINLAATVRGGKGTAKTHWGPWREALFAETVIQTLMAKRLNLAIAAWGNPAQKLVEGVSAHLDSLYRRSGVLRLTAERHTVFKAPHPSPLSARRGFFGCGHFEAINDYLESTGKPRIVWGVRG